MVQPSHPIFAAVHALCAVKRYHVEGETSLWENDILEDLLSGASVFHSTDHIIVVPVGVISKIITSHYLNVPENRVHDSSSRICSLEILGASDSFRVYRELPDADESRQEAHCLPSGNLVTAHCFVCTDILLLRPSWLLA
jgi:hypothetical protein